MMSAYAGRPTATAAPDLSSRCASTTSDPTRSSRPAIDWMTNGPAWTMNFRSSVEMRAHAAAAGPDLARRGQPAPEIRVAVPEAGQERVTAGDRIAVDGVDEDRVALELRQGERGHGPSDDAIEQARHQRVGVRNAAVGERIVAMRAGDGPQEPGVPAELRGAVLVPAGMA